MTDPQIALPVPADPTPGAGRVTTASRPRVIGLDLSAASTGVALPDGDTFTIKEPRIKGKKRTLTDDLARMCHIADAIEIALLHHPELIVIEDYAAGIRSAAAHRLAEVGGVVRLACHRARVPIALVNVMHLKIYATGRGNAEKRDMAVEAVERAGLKFPNSDECDAWWLQAMGLDHLGRPPVPLPKLHRGALAKVTWPEGTTP